MSSTETNTVRRELDLETLRLAKGAHKDTQDAMCVMEAAAYIAGEPWSDTPECVSPVIAAFLRTWNDDLDDDGRQMLKRFIRAVIGTRGTAEQEERRAWLALDWLIRVHTVTWLRLAHLDEHANALEALPPQTSHEALRASAAVIAAASAAARDAARDAATDAATDAVRAAATTAVIAAATTAVWAADRAAVWAAVWAADRAAATAALKPTVEALQRSACELVDRMIACA